MAIKLSFIIPVYNSEDYLEECLESILSQITNECEVLLIDDGSTDKSANICNAYAEKYSIVSVVYQENAGPSAARNLGIESVQGEYLCFVDSDDRIMASSVTQMVDWIDKGGADLCFMDARKLFPDGNHVPLGDNICIESVRGKSKLEVMEHLRTRPKFPGSPCTKLYKRAFLKQHGITFPDDKRYAEDLGFVLDCIMKADSFDVLDFPYYVYRQGRENSRSSLIERSFFGMAMFVEESAAKLTENKQPKDQIGNCAMAFVAYEYSIMLWYFSKLHEKDREAAFDILTRYRWVLKYGASKKTRVIRLMADAVGLSVTSKLLNYYMSLR